jgi:ribose transport system permease protein
MSMNTSVKSTALEPGKGTGSTRRILTIYGMVFLAAILFAGFALAKPETFPTLLNFQLLASAKSVLLVIALGVTVPMVTGKIDLSVGYGAGLWQVMVLSWQINGMDYRLAIFLAVVGGAVVGLVNALLVELAQVDAFIATLATGQVVYAITMWYTGGAQITDSNGLRAKAFDQIATWSLGPIPGPFIIAVVLAVLLWAVLEFLPVGRYLYAVGANPAAARLTGIPRRWCVVGAMTTSGVLAALAGVMLASRQAGIAQANIGPDFLMPALAAAFLGSTTIKPGRINALGTVLGVFITTVGISGLQQVLPGKFYLEPLFNGLTLIAAITIASMASRRRLARADQKFSTDDAPPGGDALPPLVSTISPFGDSPEGIERNNDVRS